MKQTKNNIQEEGYIKEKKTKKTNFDAEKNTTEKESIFTKQGEGNKRKERIGEGK